MVVQENYAVKDSNMSKLHFKHYWFDICQECSLGAYVSVRGQDGKYGS